MGCLLPILHILHEKNAAFFLGGGSSAFYLYFIFAVAHGGFCFEIITKRMIEILSLSKLLFTCLQTIQPIGLLQQSVTSSRVKYAFLLEVVGQSSILKLGPRNKAFRFCLLFKAKRPEMLPISHGGLEVLFIFIGYLLLYDS